MLLYFLKDNLVCNAFPKKETHMFLLGGRFAIRHLITLYIILLVVTTLIVRFRKHTFPDISFDNFIPQTLLCVAKVHTYVYISA